MKEFVLYVNQWPNCRVYFRRITYWSSIWWESDLEIVQRIFGAMDLFLKASRKMRKQEWQRLYKGNFNFNAEHMNCLVVKNASIFLMVIVVLHAIWWHFIMGTETTEVVMLRTCTLVVWCTCHLDHLVFLFS